MTDSDPRSKADAEWEQLLRQWRAQSAAQPRPYFYHRVRARLDDEARVDRTVLPAWLRRPAYAVTLGLLVVALSGDCAALTPSGTAAPRQDQPAVPQPPAPAH